APRPILPSPPTCTLNPPFSDSSFPLLILPFSPILNRTPHSLFHMAASPRSVHCQLRSSLPDVPPRSPPASISLPKLKSADSDTPKILLQPRLCTLRSFGSDPVVPIKAKRVAAGDASDDDDVSRFFATLSEYIESSKDSHELCLRRP
ncbi:Stress enhanced protein 2, chloroplastic, partial [Cucurbita argyrosperma subsp. argyrosperma]